MSRERIPGQRRRELTSGCEEVIPRLTLKSKWKNLALMSFDLLIHPLGDCPSTCLQMLLTASASRDDRRTIESGKPACEHPTFIQQHMTSHKTQETNRSGATHALVSDVVVLVFRYVPLTMCTVQDSVSLCFVAQSLWSFKSLIMYQVGTGASQKSQRPSFAQTLTCSTSKRDPFNHFLVPSFFFLGRFLQGWGVSFVVHILGTFFVHITTNLVTTERFHDFFALPLAWNIRDRPGELLQLENLSREIRSANRATTLPISRPDFKTT